MRWNLQQVRNLPHIVSGVNRRIPSSSKTLVFNHHSTRCKKPENHDLWVIIGLYNKDLRRSFPVDSDQVGETVTLWTCNREVAGLILGLNTGLSGWSFWFCSFSPSYVRIVLSNMPHFYYSCSPSHVTRRYITTAVETSQVTNYTVQYLAWKVDTWEISCLYGARNFITVFKTYLFDISWSSWIESTLS
jgi:hypothetical protein